MSRTINTRRRLSLLASSSLAVASLMGGAGLVSLTPTQALAADECGDPSLNAGGDDVLACNGAYATGINYTATVDGNLVLLMVDTVTVADGGVRVIGGAGESLGITTVTGIPGAGDLNVTNTGGFGITLTGDTADVAVTITESDAADGTPSVSGSVGGIRIRTTNGGNADLVMEAGTATGTGSYGLSAQTTGGGSATVDFGSTTVSGAEGVRAQAPGGTASVTGSGAITTTGAGYGVFAGGGAGGSTVDVSGDIVAADVGVRAQATGGGNVTVTVGNITAGGVALSAEALSGGNVNVLGTGNLEGSSGIEASANLGGNVSVTTGGTTTGTAGDGIDLSATLGGTVFLDSSAGLVTAASVGVNVTTFDGDQDITVGDITALTGTGIDLEATGAGGITLNIVGDVFADEGSNITTQSGDIDITIAAGGSIESLDQSSFITVDVDANAGGNIAITVDGGVTGEVNANAFGGGTITFDGAGGVNESGGFGAANFVSDTGDIVLEFDGAITGAGNALTAQTADGDVTGTMDADITANGGDAVFIDVTGTGSVNLTFNGTIDGGPNAGNDGIEISTVTGDITLTTNGTVTGDPGVVLNSAGGVILYNANNDVTGDAGGITATNTTGPVTINVNFAGTDIVGDDDGDLSGDGINVQTAGAINVTTAAGSTVSGGAGILVTGGAGDVNVETNGTVTSSNGAGVSASGAGIVNVTTTSVTSTGGNGVSGFSSGGPVTIDTTFGIITTTNGNGVQGQSLGGGILDIDVATVTATGGYGVVGSSNGGALTIDTFGAVTGGAAGIRSVATSGTTVITTSNAAITGTAGDGIEAASTSGSILVNAFGSVSGTADGIDATSTSGNVSVSTGFGTTSGGTGDGVNIETAGAGVGTAVLFGAITGVNGVDVATTDGLADVQGNGSDVTVTSTAGDAIQASSVNGGTSVTLLGADGAIVAVGGDGVDATSTGAGVSVVNSWTIDATGTGIAASGVTAADVTNTGVISGNAAAGITAQSSAGSVFVDNDAAIGSAANGVTTFGILGFASGGAGTVTVSTDADVFGDDFGVVAQSNGTGNIDLEIGSGITVEGTATYGIAAIQANGAAVATVDVEVGDATAIVGGVGGIVALNVGTGVTTVTLGDNVVIDPTDYGVYMAGGGEQTLVAGSNLNIDINNTDADATAVGILVASTALADVAVGDPTVDIQIGTGLVITVDDGVGGQADGSAGIGVQTLGSASSSIVIGDGHSILVVGDASVGVGASSDTGDISITTGTGLIQVSTGDGADATANFPGTAAIGAISTGGNISITSNGGLGANAAAGLGAAGIYGETIGTGTVTVVVNGGIGSTDDGVDVNSVDGDISVTLSALSGGINATNHGIQAVTFGAGDVTVTANQSISTTQNDGIQATSTTGSVLIDTAAGIVITSGNDAIEGYVDGGAGSLVITNRAALDPNALAGGYGVWALNNGSGLTNVTQTATGSVSGRAIYGLVAISGTGTGQVTVTNGGSIGTAGDAVDFDGIYVEIQNAASAAGAGVSNSGAIFAGGNAIYVNNDGTGAASVNNTGALVAGDEGIEVVTAGGGISVNSNGTIVAGDSGILTSNSGAGTTQINVNASIAASLAPATGAGVNASTTGTGVIDVNVANGVSVAGNNGSAIRTSSNGGAVTVDLGTGGVGALATTATSAGAGATSWVVDLNNAAGGTTTLTVASNATVRSTDNTTTGYDDLAIRGIGGSVVINNAGRIQGRVNFAGLTGNVVFNNTSGLSWHTTGTSTFSGGADILNNAAAGVIYTNAGGAATTFDFGAGADTFTNAGILVAGEPALAASTLTITSLETWNNSGSIFFGSAGTTASDGQINDRILAAGTTFNGSGNSRLYMDVNLGAVTQASCAALAAADCLSLTGGTTTGSTTIRFNDVSGNAFGAFNPTGIVVVDVSGAGATSGTNFSLLSGQPLWRADLNSADGVLDKGLFFYDLTLNGNKQHVLVGLPDGEAFEFTTVGQAAQSAWYSTTGTWFDRQADLRDQLDDTEAGAGVWMKITGSAADRDLINSYDLFGVTYSFDTSYDQNTVSLIGGIDFVGASTADSQWVIGGMIGYVDSDVNFDASPTAYSLEGLVIGAYASYVNKGYFVDGVISGNLMSMDYQAPTLAPSPNNIFSGDVDTWGGQVEGGYTFALGGAAFIEPLVSLAYVTTSIDAITVPGATIEWDDQTSLRGSLGARIGTTAEMDTFDAKFSLTGRIWNEFEGENELTILSGGPDLGLSDDFSGSFGEVSGSVNLFSNKAAFSAFVNAGVKFKDDYQSTDATLGFRWRW